MSQSDVPNIDIGGTALGVIWTLTIVTILIVGARCYTQHFVTRQFGLSEILIVISACVVTGMASVITAQHHYGWGRHFQYIPEVNVSKAIELNYVTQSFGVMGSTFGRMSFIVLMVKLFGTSKMRRIILWALFWAQFISNSVVVVTLYAQCKDVRALWDFSIKSACWPENAQSIIGYAHSAWNGATDLFLTILPATMLWTLKMNLKTKLGLIFLLSLSFLAFLGVIMKVVYLGVLAHRADYTYNTVPLFTWVIVEATLVAIASSAPSLRPLFFKFTNHESQASSNTYEFDKYASKNPTASFGTSRRFSKLPSPAVVGDSGSEDGILPIQSPEYAITKHVRVDVSISDLEKGELGNRTSRFPSPRPKATEYAPGHSGDLTPWQHR